jgi:proline dehydrogenase
MHRPAPSAEVALILRKTLLWLSSQPRIWRFVRKNRLVRSVASRFVAGETPDSAVAAAVALKEKGITTSLDVLGESVREAPAAEAAAAEYHTVLERLASAQVAVNVSVKPSQVGLDLDPALCERNLRHILDRARALNGFVRLDMESSAYTQRTLDLFERLRPDADGGVGVVIQAALRRSTEDVERLITRSARVRLCKGAYLEPAAVAYPDKPDVDAHYQRLMERLLAAGNYPGIATHDERLIRHAQRFAESNGIGRERFEFQMLYGVRRDLQDQLRSAGWNVRVYVPFGTQWYPYLMRRLAERPANVAFILGSVIREGVSRKSIPN